MTTIEADLPIGVGIHLVSDQPVVVEEAVGGFTKALFEAVAIVLVVSFISLGFRAGLVVALTIPMVLAITFVSMELFQISLQRISLGVVAALVPSGAPLGFVAILGVLALIGILIRNLVILVIQIEELRKEGSDAWNAVVDA